MKNRLGFDGRNLSTREYVLIILFFAFIITYGIYSFILEPSFAKLNELKDEEMSLRTQVEILREVSETLDAIKDEINALNKEISAYSVRYPDCLVSSSLIESLDGLSKSSGIDIGTITVGEVTAAGAEGAYQRTLSINVTGSFNQILAFLEGVKNSDRYISINSLDVRSNLVSSLDASMKLTYISYGTDGLSCEEIPVKEPENLDNFFYFRDMGISEEDYNEIMSGETPSFFIVINNRSEIANKVVFSEYGNLESELDYTKSDKTTARLELSGSGDVLSYEMTLDGESYAGTLAAEGDVLIKVISSKRLDTSDKVGVDLSLVNSTDKNLIVKVSYEDENSPRLKIVSKEGKVEVQ